MLDENIIIAVIGLGYVGLPLAVEFGKIRRVIGFDTNKKRVEELQLGIDQTRECSSADLGAAKLLEFSCNPNDLKRASIFIITVPTPVDSSKRPNMEHLIEASTSVGRALSKGALVIYESTVYPGATEEVCVPVLEQQSGLSFNTDFFCGYSPERINPGDKVNTLTNIRKITSGSTPDSARAVDNLYKQIITAGTHPARSIKIAEAAKVVENTQRDLNIALMNELSLIFFRLSIDTTEVLEAAGTKWNFLPFRPGLVGGHCIGIDPYYLMYKAQQVGYHPEVILAGRRVNDSIARHVADETVKLMLKKGISVLNARILVLGLAFKENCPDVRNSKVADLVAHLSSYHCQVDVYDPWISAEDAQHELGIQCLRNKPQERFYQSIILAVGHQQFKELGVAGIKAFGLPDAVIYDVKSLLPPECVDGRL